MHHTGSSLVASLFLLSACSASPFFNNEHSKAHRVPVNASARNGPQSLAKIYQKYGWPMPADLSAALVSSPKEKMTTTTQAGSGSSQLSQSSQGTLSGSVTANPASDNTEYLCEATVGGQVVYLNLDTASSDLWLFNNDLPSRDQGSHQIYDSSKSRSFRQIPGASFEVTYGDGTSTSGTVAIDTVTIGGISVSHQAIELPNKISSSMISDPSDGIVGLGFKVLNGVCVQGSSSQQPSNCPAGFVRDPQPTWIQNAAPYLAGGIFTANLKAGSAGYFNFGTLDHTAYKGQINYSPIDNSRGYWQFALDGYKVGSGQATSFSGAPAIADTGTSLIVLEQAPVTAFWQQVQGSQNTSTGWIYPCSASVPDLTISIGSYNAVIPGKLMNFSPAGSNSPGMCYGGLQARTSQSHQILGDIFFQAQFAVFDVDNNRIGFAPHLNLTKPGQTRALQGWLECTACAITLEQGMDDLRPNQVLTVQIPRTMYNSNEGKREHFIGF